MHLIIENLSLKYEEKILLENCNFEIESDIIQLSGRNGVGKSSLLKAIYNGDYTGSVKINGTEMKSKKQNSKLISFVPQAALLVEDASVTYNLKLLGLDVIACKNYIEKFDKTIDFKSKVSSLSGGQKQLINIMIGIKTECELLILDEPYNNLSNTNCKKVEAELINLNVPIILVTHKATGISTSDVRIERRKLICKN